MRKGGGGAGDDEMLLCHVRQLVLLIFNTITYGMMVCNARLLVLLVCDALLVVYGLELSEEDVGL